MLNPAKGRPHLELWNSCWSALQSLRPAFSRHDTFMWFATALVGMMVRSDLLGLTSLIRALNLRPKLYNSLRRHFHSSAIKLDKLVVLWGRTVLRLFSNPVRFNGRLVLVGDGIKIPKRGKKMPGVKLLHQQSNCSTKPEYIMGHSLQAVALLVYAASTCFAVPLTMRIHEGLVWSNRDKRTLLDKMLDLLQIVAIADPFYFVADAYYAARKVVKGLRKQGNHLVTRVKSNAVAYLPAGPAKGRRKRGRPKLYGKKIKINSVLRDVNSMAEADANLYGERGVKIQYCVRDLVWRPVGELVRFVAVVHPTRGKILLMSTDLTLDALDIISLYGFRFKIEHMFRQAVRQVGSLSYHFWMMDMTSLRYRNGNQYLHRKSDRYRKQVRDKIHAYHTFIQTGIIAHGLLQYLSAEFPKSVWCSFGSWLRTIRPGIPPSELVVGKAMHDTLPDFLMSCAKRNSLAKFMVSRQEKHNLRILRLAS
ncbi:MAG TPA: transposase [Candidatus Sulfotelmatobacter sp.]|nr:transposase [Candidatus Sulfotelmatobacter sp.]